MQNMLVPRILEHVTVSRFLLFCVQVDVNGFMSRFASGVHHDGHHMFIPEGLEPGHVNGIWQIVFSSYLRRPMSSGVNSYGGKTENTGKVNRRPNIFSRSWGFLRTSSTNSWFFKPAKDPRKSISRTSRSFHLPSLLPKAPLPPAGRSITQQFKR